jgi:tetratricopeptide (TPR) repeat protein
MIQKFGGKINPNCLNFEVRTNLTMKRAFLCGAFFVAAFHLIAQEDVNEVVLRDIKKNNTARIEDLVLRNNADINYRDGNKAPLLMWAALKTNLDFVKKLVKLGANPKLKGVIYLDDDKTAFYGSLMSIAVAENKPELVKYLVDELKIPVDDREYDPDANADIGWTGIEWASHTLNRPLLNYFVGKGAVVQEGVFIYGGMNLTTQRKYPEAIEWTRGLMRDFSGKMKGDSSLAFTYFILATAEFELNQPEQAIGDYQAGLKHAEAAKSQPHLLLYPLNLGLGLSYEKINDYSKARDYFQKLVDSPQMLTGAQMYVIIDYPSRMVEALACLGRSYAEGKRYAEAESTLLEALQRARAEKKPNVGTVNVLSSLGEVMLAQKQFERARSYFEQAIREIPALQRPREYTNLGKAYAGLGMFEKAEAAHKQALDLSFPGDKESVEYAAAVVKNFTQLYVESRNFEKVIPAASIYLRAMLEPKNEAALSKEDHVEIYNEFRDMFLLVASVAVRDSAFSNLTYNYLAAMTRAQGKTGATMTWKQTREKLGKKDATIEIFPTTTLDTESFPAYYAAVFTKRSAAVEIISLYNKETATADLDRGHKIMINLMHQDPAMLAARSGAILEALKETGGDVYVNVYAEKKPDIKLLYDFDTQKYFLDGVNQSKVKAR